jgi:hypothetical protein
MADAYLLRADGAVAIGLALLVWTWERYEVVAGTIVAAALLGPWLVRRRVDD